MQVIPSSNYVLDASTRTITLLDPYDNLELAQLLKITDLDTDDDVYDFNTRRAGVEISSGVISWTGDTNITSDDDELRILVDRADNMTTDHMYGLVDRGQLFRNFHKYDLEIATSADMLIKCGSEYPHVLLNAVGDGDTLIQFFVAPTVTEYGTEEPAGNFNFNSGNTSLTKWYAAPTISDVGIYFARTWVLGGSGQGTPAEAKAAASMEGMDVVLIPNTDFLIRFTNMAGRDLQILFEVNYKEVPFDVS